MIHSLLQRMDCHAFDLGHVPDDKEQITQRIAAAMAQVNVLFITGGMSMGKYDFTPQVLQK